jgi:hypothetical protein
MYARYGYASGHVVLRAWHVRDRVTEFDFPLNSEKNGTGSIAPLALFHIALLRADGFFAKPLLALNKHVAVRENLNNVAQEALR